MDYTSKRSPTDTIHSFLLTLAALFLIVCAMYICVGIIRDGLARVNTQSMLRSAEEDRRNGQTLKALKKYSRWSWMVLEGGIRWRMAQPLLKQTKALCYEGRFSEALDRCAAATEALRGYDNEGALGYECYLIDTRIKHPEYFTSHGSRPWLRPVPTNTGNED